MTDGSADTAGGADSGPDPDPDPDPMGSDSTTGEPQVEPDPLFIEGEVIEIALQLPDASVEALRDSPKEYVEGSVNIRGKDVPQIGVKLRGNYGSLTTFDEKPKMRFDFNRYVQGQKPFGLKALDLNNGKQDCAALNERVGYEGLEALGLPARRTAHAHVTINGDDYGVYTILEKQDDDFLERYFEDATGNLYNGSIYSNEDGLSIDDIQEHLAPYFRQQEGVDVGNVDMIALGEVMDDYVAGTASYAEVSELWNWHAFHVVWAWEFWSGQNDGYISNRNNYRLYFDPLDGRANLFPTDLDHQFYAKADKREGLIAIRCAEDSQCWSTQVEVAAEVFATLEAANLGARFDELSDFIRPYVDADPRRELICTPEDLELGRTGPPDFIVGRTAEVSAAWGV